MQLYVELRRARPHWYALSNQQKEEVLGQISREYAQAGEQGIELVGIVLNDSGQQGSSDYQFLAVWKIPDGVTWRMMGQQVDGYFDVIGAGGDIRNVNEAMAWLRKLTPEADAQPHGNSGSLWHGTLDDQQSPSVTSATGGWMRRLAAGLGQLVGRQPESPRLLKSEPEVPDDIPVVHPPQPMIEEPPGESSLPQPPVSSTVPTVTMIDRQHLHSDAIPAGSGLIDVAACLERIGWSGSLGPTSETLRGLHRAYLLAVPFENLDILLGRPILLDERAVFTKIVVNRRGGFCYELNALFAVLLRELGFDVTLISARVARDNGDFGPEFDHLALVVRTGERWLVDVGFGDSFLEPLRLDEADVQQQGGEFYRLVRQQGQRLLQRSDDGAAWKSQYCFTLLPRQLQEFSDMCDFHQTSPQSHFTHGRICSLATADGRLTLTDSMLIRAEQSQRHQQPLSSAMDVEELLRSLFGIELPAEVV